MAASDKNIAFQIMCYVHQEESGPTRFIFLSEEGDPTVPPEIDRILKAAFTKDKSSNDNKGVLCKDPPALVLEAFKKTRSRCS